MTDKQVQAEAPHSNMEKDPSDWVTGDEPMTGAQMSYLKTLSEEAGAEFDESLTKAAASEQIEALQKETGRGTSGHGKVGHSAANHAGASHSAATKTEAAPAQKADTADTPVSAKRKVSHDDDADEAQEGDLFEAEGAAEHAKR